MLANGFGRHILTAEVALSVGSVFLTGFVDMLASGGRGKSLVANVAFVVAVFVNARLTGLDKCNDICTAFVAVSVKLFAIGTSLTGRYKLLTNVAVSVTLSRSFNDCINVSTYASENTAADIAYSVRILVKVT